MNSKKQRRALTLTCHALFAARRRAKRSDRRARRLAARWLVQRTATYAAVDDRVVPPGSVFVDFVGDTGVVGCRWPIVNKYGDDASLNYSLPMWAWSYCQEDRVEVLATGLLQDEVSWVAAASRQVHMRARAAHLASGRTIGEYDSTSEV